MLGTIWKRWNWLEGALIPLSAALMYAAWVYPLFALFLRDSSTGQPNPGFSFWLCLAVLLAGAAAGRLASQNDLGVVIVVVGGFAAILVCLFLVLPSGSESLDLWFAELTDRVKHGREGEPVPLPLVVILCAGLLWWRGVRSASPSHTEAAGAFAVGVTVLAGLLVVALVLPSSWSAPGSLTGRGAMSSIAAPLVFVISIPATVLFAVLTRYVGEIALTLSQLALAVGWLALALVLPSGPSPAELVGWFLLFMASGLITLSLLGALASFRDQERRIGIRLHIDRYWVLTALSVIAGILVLGILIGQLIAPGTIIRILSWLKPIWTLLLRIVLFVWLILAYLFFSLVEPLLAQREGRPSEPVARPTMDLSLEDVEPAAESPLAFPPILGQIARIILILGGVAIIALIFYRAIQRRKQRTEMAEDDVRETRETILSVDLLRTQLSGLLDALRRKRPPPLFAELGPPGDPRRVIRELYQRVLASAISLGAPRRKAQTPSTYEHTVSSLCPEHESSLRTLTSAYVVARYADEVPTEEQVQEALDAFSLVDRSLQDRAEGSEKY